MKKIVTFIIFCILIQSVSFSQHVRTTVRPKVTTHHRTQYHSKPKPSHPKPPKPRVNKPKPHSKPYHHNYNDYLRYNNHYFYHHHFYNNNWYLRNNIWLGYWLFAHTHGNQKYIIDDTDFIIYDIVFDDNLTYSIVHEKRTFHNHLIIINKNDQILVKQEIKKKYQRIQLVNDFIVLLEKNENPDDIEKYIYDKTQNILYKSDI